MANWKIDTASVGLGLVTGAALLAIVLSHTENHSPKPEVVVRDARPAAPAIGDVLRLERSRTRHVQSLLDSVIGPGQAIARVAIVDWDDRGDVLAVKRMSLALAVDQTKVIYDPEANEWINQIRSDTETQMLQQLAARAAGLDSARGDLLAASGMPIDKSVEIMDREMRVSGERRHFWTTTALLVMAVALAFSTGRQVAGRSAAAWVATGVTLLALASGWISLGETILVGVGSFLAIGGLLALVAGTSPSTNQT